MKRSAIVCLLGLLLLLPMKAWSGRNCDQYGDQIVAAQEEMQQLAAQYKDKILSEGEAKALGQQMKALSEKGEAARKQWSACVGMPTSAAEARQMEADQKAAAEEAARQWEAQAKQFLPENMPGPMGAGGAGAGASMFALPLAQEPSFTPAPIST